MKIVYSEHAIKRMGQRAITELHIEYVLEHPNAILNSYEGTKIAVGMIDGRTIKVVFIKKENYIKVITVR